MPGSHREVVFAVVRGQVDVGLATRAWAEALGLAFRLPPSDRWPSRTTACSCRRPSERGPRSSATDSGVIRYDPR